MTIQHPGDDGMVRFFSTAPPSPFVLPQTRKCVTEYGDVLADITTTTDIMEESDSATNVLYRAELVLNNGSYTLVVRDLVHGTLRMTGVPRRMVAKFPAYLSMLNLQHVDE
ncbi:hypothetical protein [Streptomyces roseochromogenus]|uniref:Uncharacterized protein n=1 Tax=Streptomyces roseochromogenus subsp. oscitans DS 12.976 TaxID=1352936 RepID=V6KC24_STRRC|nr:hypothetical protein [Streptomyces roseochromogenus]EST28991.1 hypothetical protein M878_21630 [Streptomyces roseochromogenus subsp. oscitans DS 12.976]